MSADQVDSLVGDYNSERDQLGEWDLDEIYTRIEQLAREEVAKEDRD